LDALLIASNGTHSRVGSLTANWEHLFAWQSAVSSPGIGRCWFDLCPSEFICGCDASPSSLPAVPMISQTRVQSADRVGQFIRASGDRRSRVWIIQNKKRKNC
jgi:hypothetical protein